MMTVRQRQRQRARARAWWASLNDAQRHQLGDELVLGCWEWIDWGFERAPSPTFLDEVDRLRMNWESE
jgi:hypothetical protein